MGKIDERTHDETSNPDIGGGDYGGAGEGGQSRVRPPGAAAPAPLSGRAGGPGGLVAPALGATR